VQRLGDTLGHTDWCYNDVLHKIERPHWLSDSYSHTHTNKFAVIHADWHGDCLCDGHPQ